MAPVEEWCDTVVGDIAAEGCDEGALEVETEDVEVLDDVDEVEDSDVVLGKADLVKLVVVDDAAAELVDEEEVASQPPALYWQSSACWPVKKAGVKFPEQPPLQGSILQHPQNGNVGDGAAHV